MNPLQINFGHTMPQATKTSASTSNTEASLPTIQFSGLIGDAIKLGKIKIKKQLGGGADKGVPNSKKEIEDRVAEINKEIEELQATVDSNEKKFEDNFKRPYFENLTELERLTKKMKTEDNSDVLTQMENEKTTLEAKVRKALEKMQKAQLALNENLIEKDEELTMLTDERAVLMVKLGDINDGGDDFGFD